MLDFTHIPSKATDRQIFYAQSGSNSWQIWRKPKNAKMVHMFCLGSGGGGGGGGINNTSPIPGGGGGGASSYTIGTFLASSLPDILYIRVPIGGAGGLSAPFNAYGTKGSDGEISYISLSPSTSSILLASGNIPAKGASAGSATNGPGGAGGTVWVSSGLSVLGSITSTPGVTGTTAPNGESAVLDGPSLNALSNGVVTGGAAGGGRSDTNGGFNGGSIISASVLLLSTVQRGLGAGLTNGTAGTPGQDGYGILYPIFCGTGGAGGGAAKQLSGSSGNNGYGGNGGNGFYGSGGGGGSTKSSGAIAGTGGKGGDGIVIITTSI